MSNSVLMIGAFDTKGAEYAFLRERLLANGLSVVALNVGVMGGCDLFPIDIGAEAAASAGGCELAALREAADRGKAMSVMAEGSAFVTRSAFEDGRFQAVIGMGGSGGTSVVTAAMRALPIGVPKVCVSTVAGGDTSSYVGEKDVVLIPSLTDVAGINRISARVMTQAAGALTGMMAAEPANLDVDKPIIAASMFGNTTECVEACRRRLEAEGYEVLVFHATGAGGRMMESLIDEGLVDACLDITTTELADTLCGGVFDAGPDRLSAAGRAGIPHLIVPGCLDMVNFGPAGTVPANYRSEDRLLYEWNPSVTLMRTNAKENQKLGRLLAEKANAARGLVTVLLPLQGVSVLDGDGERFCDREADEALFQSLRQHIDPRISVEEVDANINDAAFSNRAVELLLGMMRTAAPENKRATHASASGNTNT